MKLHQGINTNSIAGEGLAGLPGLLIIIAFVFIFVSLFLPRNAENWFLLLFLVVEIGSAVLYIWIDRRNRKESDGLRKQLHRMNEENNRGG